MMVSNITPFSFSGFVGCFCYLYGKMESVVPRALYVDQVVLHHSESHLALLQSEGLKTCTMKPGLILF